MGAAISVLQVKQVQLPDCPLEKASVRGQHKCSECKQHFRLRDRLLEHIEQYHTTAKIQYTCGICKVALDDKKSFDVHKKQHDMDSKCSKGKLQK